VKKTVLKRLCFYFCHSDPPLAEKNLSILIILLLIDFTLPGRLRYSGERFQREMFGQLEIKPSVVLKIDKILK